MSLLLDGKTVAASYEKELSGRVTALKARNGGQTPILATILVGDDPASATYVAMKGNACRRVGMDSSAIRLSASATTADVLAEIDRLNADPTVHGILLQHPVPAHVDERLCFDRISIAKDVDGVTSHGFGLMALGEPAFGSATPAGIMRLLAHYEIDVAGKRAVVVGRSPILGKPMAFMLSNANATVTLCHSKTMNLEAEIRRAQIVVGAVGKPKFIRSEWISDGAIVIDAGYHPGGIGDIDLDGLMERCAAVTPVPGGVGPMTISTLIAQTVSAAERAYPVA
ncbi:MULTISPECIES: tetrahydrofolate dehydrogenase/cyclohydrolase catalytic domain-containing protein [Paraburkholderia]|uniref:tetrahydrofolate dehydrogenase/cyclohydrolase catalytic domain-containing protein n=1 Tax=Paraburkholderia TaxID=1822464 RepID=UPI002252C63D|nr:MULTISPECIES: tetrahydrofolate dehydrogenase/cyclohydrolase catalytic domain-containing protein [Paraburkholderia]MCX4166208.1 bifunctional 5,10-methylene-tetrahydrofolate dehydrogenase/5,10-methylene-tetrahydrofolate cyclohydrolase [Paraburkholderia megapolitana]MDN7161698.1 bifunctional 5,10-methylene-tetrahydrofolate dehydrogenase/5,10-methylene-tetrahydrofolate cyclohydrolase [Paraburkholderia sp. CHISQ3]MDQ6498746.1 bifunctional 5,10-methylene-tetrahydrofolate dehydrogenase/5,10-methylen